MSSSDAIPLEAPAAGTLAAMVCEAIAGEPGWRFSRAGSLWARAEPSAIALPDQGWKLHVTATPVSAREILARCLPILIRERAAFKCAASAEAVERLNNQGASSQAGKFLTVYAVSDDQAVRLARDLDTATRGLPGPPVVSELAVAPDSRVSFRYGGFATKWMQLPSGEVAPAIAAPDGRLVPDRRAAGMAIPPWLADSGMAKLAERAKADAGGAPPDSQLIAGRFVPLARLYESPRGVVALALDADTGERRVVKCARRFAMARQSGADAQSDLRREFDALTRLAGMQGVPLAHGLFEHTGDLWLALDDVGSLTLERRALDARREGKTLPIREIAAIATDVADIVARVHTRGFAHRDIKASNVVFDGADTSIVSLVDYGSACELGATAGKTITGSRGYMSPAQARGEAASESDDIYGIGAMLWFLVAGAEPSAAPNALNLAARPLTLLAPDAPPALSAIIGRCLGFDDAPFASMRDVAISLREIADGELAVASDDQSPIPALAMPDAAIDAMRRASRVADAVCASAIRDGDAVSWVSRARVPDGVPARYLYDGAAGVVFALSKLAPATGSAAHLEYLRLGARTLANRKALPGARPTGLFIGEAGVGAALLSAGIALGDESLIEQAGRIGGEVSANPPTGLDLMHGSAGVVRFLVALWIATGNRDHLDAASEIALRLCDAAEPRGEGVAWRSPDGAYQLGYAHGAAGIADTLLDVYAETGDSRLLETASQVLAWLKPLAHPTLPDGSGDGWPAVEGQPLSPPHWCHGAAGIGRFALRCAHFGVVGADEAARRATTSAARAGRWCSPNQCHGLASQIELLVDAYQATGEARWLDDANDLGVLLAAFESKAMPGVYAADQPGVVTPDLMLGYSGVGLALLRLAEPQSSTHALSAKGIAGAR